MTIRNISFYDLDKINICQKIYGKNFKRHPYYKKFNVENYKFMNFAFDKKNYKNLSHKFLCLQIILKKDLKKRFILLGRFTLEMSPT